MVEFKKLLGDKKTIDHDDLVQLFTSLDRQGSHTVLRPSQHEALDAFTARKDLRDTVLKISTGAGKTTLGLLYLYSHMKRYTEPVVYLCPTVQLVGQVLAEADSIGITATHYESGNPYPGADAQGANSIIVCTYEKLFNGLSTFNRRDVMLRPCALVLDDVHSGAEIVRKSSTLTLTGDARSSVIELLSNECREYKNSTWRDIEDNDVRAIMEIPFWIWQSKVSEIEIALKPYLSTKECKFVWPTIAENLHLCRCVVSGSSVEIAPWLPLTSKHPAYSQAKHRLFMSATLADDSVLVRDLGLELNAALDPVEPDSDRGIGERMILVPSLVDTGFNRQRMMEMCRDFAETINVVVLSPSFDKAKDWCEYGATLFDTDDISSGVARLKDKNSDLKFAVFAQRYDGVDLPDTACRLLVLDGMPMGESLIDSQDYNHSSATGGVLKKLVYKIEQGTGRAVRSHADYAVVLLVGEEIANFVSKRDVLDTMNEDTQRQLSLAIELSKLIKKGSKSQYDALIQTMNQCIERDEDWKEFYNQEVRDQVGSTKEVDKMGCVFAEATENSFNLAQSNAFADASALFDQSLSESGLDGIEKAIQLQNLASLYHHYDPAKAFQVQQGAFSRNAQLMRPPQTVKNRQNVVVTQQGLNFHKWYTEFKDPNGALVELHRIRSLLDYSNGYKKVELGLLEFSRLMGAIGSRPEQELNEGPDCLWLWPETALVIEAKNENERTLHKKDAGQLLLSLQWFNRAHPDYQSKTIVPLIAADTSKPDRYSDYPGGSRVLDQSNLNSLFDTVEQLLIKMINEGQLFSTEENITSHLKEYGLTDNTFVKNFTLPLSK